MGRRYAFGPEPELHRLYALPRSRGRGIGGELMRGLHERLPASAGYMLVALEGTDRAVAFRLILMRAAPRG